MTDTLSRCDISVVVVVRWRWGFVLQANRATWIWSDPDRSGAGSLSGRGLRPTGATGDRCCRSLSGGGGVCASRCLVGPLFPGICTMACGAGGLPLGPSLAMGAADLPPFFGGQAAVGGLSSVSASTYVRVRQDAVKRYAADVDAVHSIQVL